MRGNPGSFPKGIALIAICIAFVAIGILFFGRPRIDRVNPYVFESGSIIEIEGKGFGAERRGKTVEIDGSPIIESAYLSWSARRISITAPNSPGPSLVRVTGPLGASDPAIIIAKTALPKPIAEDGSAFAAPRLISIEPTEARVGDLLVLRGSNFGLGPEFSSVLFARNPSAPARSVASDLGRETADLFIEPDTGGSLDGSPYEFWDDKEIRVRVPEYAGSGSIRVRSPQGVSQALEFKLKPIRAQKYYYDPTSYTIEFFISLEARRIGPGGSILIHFPDPDSTSSQSLISVDHAVEGGPGRLWTAPGLLGLEAQGEGGPASARFSISTSILVYGVETELSAYSEAFSASEAPAFLQPFLRDDPLVPAADAEIKAIVARMRGSQKNPQARAMLVRDWLMKNLAWEEKPQKISPVAALKRKRADSSNYAILACALLRAAQVPAVPLSGFLLTDDGKLIPHLWLEYYLPGLGWIPFDPVLTKGGKPGGFQGKLESDQRYFGNLDNRHIAFSRGYEKDRPRLAGGTAKASGPFWILQDLFEESVNASYTSTWNQPRLVGEILEPQAGDTPR